MPIPFVDLKAQYCSIKPEIDAALFDTIEKSAFVLGEKVERFEKNFAAFCGARHAVGVNSGTAALQLALLAYGVGPGDEVITVPNSYFATAEAIHQVGAKPVFVDVLERNYLMDPAKVEAAVSKKTKAIIPVHLTGQAADMKPILEAAEKHGLTVIEDAAQAHAAEYRGKRLPVSDCACYSFYPGKNLGAYGEGGAVVTNDAKAAEFVELYRTHGEKPKFVHRLIGHNMRLEALQAAVLDVKLKHLERWTELRRGHAKAYGKRLAEAGLQAPREEAYGKHAYHLFMVQSGKRDALRERLKQAGVETGIHYPTPIHLQEAFGFLGLKKGSYPVAERLGNRILSLPMYAELSDEQITFIAEKIVGFEKR